MRLMLSLNPEQHENADIELDAIEGPFPAVYGNGEKSIGTMLELLDTLPSATTAEAFSALRRAFPTSRLDARVEAVRKRRTGSC